MSKNEIVKRPSSTLKDKGQYAVALSLIGVMLYAAGFPVFFLLFFGVLTFFVWKIFSSGARSDVRRIFEFYLSANEILRDDYRQWYGFEIQETIARGEKIVRAIPNSPPLVHFALGALYDRLADHSSAIKHLSYICEDTGSESSIAFPSNELREYVRILRKIERSPAEAPQTSAAIRSLERSRKNTTKRLLEKNRSIADSEKTKAIREATDRLPSDDDGAVGQYQSITYAESAGNGGSITSEVEVMASTFPQLEPPSIPKRQDVGASERKTISEVLHDIYDENVQ